MIIEVDGLGSLVFNGNVYLSVCCLLNERCVCLKLRDLHELNMSSVFVVVAARIREILENVGLAQESLPSNVVASAQVLANVANLLNIRDTELSRWGFAFTKLFLAGEFRV